MKRIYIAGAYSKYTDENGFVHDVGENILEAEKKGAELIKEGWAVFIPHKNTGFMEVYDINYETFLDIDLKFLEVCDAVFVLKNYKYSKGAKKEIEYAERLGLEIIYEDEIYNVGLGGF